MGGSFLDEANPRDLQRAAAAAADSATMVLMAVPMALMGIMPLLVEQTLVRGPHRQPGVEESDLDRVDLLVMVAGPVMPVTTMHHHHQRPVQPDVREEMLVVVEAAADGVQVPLTDPPIVAVAADDAVGTTAGPTTRRTSATTMTFPSTLGTS